MRQGSQFAFRVALLAALTLLALFGSLTPVAAHRSGCHRWHSCPSDSGSYTCGDLGYCSQCPDNQYCLAGQPRNQIQVPPGPSTTTSQQLQIQLISVTSPVRPGDDATIIVRTTPSAVCLITVRYKSGPSRAQGLVSKSADSGGRAAWTWRVGTRTTPGRWPITVTCSSGRRQGSLQISFVVR